MSGMARAHAMVGWGFVGLVALQFFLAGLGMFGASDFTSHAINGTLLLLVALVLVVLAAVGRLGRQAVTLSVLVLFLAALQHVLPALRDGAPVVAALHPVNALVLLVIGYAVARGRTLASLTAEPGASRAQAVR